tara:strand:+ start:360 stop:1280 length:921 start_codon:yes stop_codon:yes gene_type:complete
MRLFKIALLIKYFQFSKNTKKALLIINAGIFLSIFACSSAIITLIIENKVNQFEYEHIVYSTDKRATELILKDLPVWRGMITQSINMEKTNEQFSEFIKLNRIIHKVVSSNDVQIYSIYSGINELEIFEELKVLLDPEMLGFEIYYNKEDVIEEKQKFQKLVNKLNKKTKNIEEKIENKKDFFRKILFESSYSDLRKDMAIDDGSIYYGEYSEIYFELRDLFGVLLDLLDFLEAYAVHQNYVNNINLELINKQIIDYSKYEKNIIFVAFVLQLIIFIIIQFFEISSVNIFLPKQLKKKIKKYNEKR